MSLSKKRLRGALRHPSGRDERRDDLLRLADVYHMALKGVNEMSSPGAGSPGYTPRARKPVVRASHQTSMQIQIPDLRSEDRQYLEAAGLTDKDIQFQLELLSQPPAAAHLVRPCTLGDGLIRLQPDRWVELEARASAAATAGRCAKFVPASGAATRMFGTLLAALEQFPEADWEEIQNRSEAGGAIARDVQTLISNVTRFPYFSDLEEVARRNGESIEALAEAGHWQRILLLLTSREGLGLGQRPKGLVPFHTTPSGAASAFDEQIEEGLPYLRDRNGTARYHFTVAPGAVSDFRAALKDLVERQTDPQQTLDVHFSEQSLRTGTLALTEAGELVRDPDGTPRLRPGGHGALLSNLEKTDGEFVYIRNIDNVLPAGAQRDETILWQRRLGGLLMSLSERAQQLVADLRRQKPNSTTRIAARQLLAETFSAASDLPLDDSEAERAALIDRLDRPLRVCGMVPNTGEPGGGPFWVRSESGMSRQIIESAQVDLHNDAQAAIWRASSHFNPVNIVCSLKDSSGKAFPLEQFVDPRAVIVANKRVDGRPARVLERPGLWNGGMAHWNTVFAEIPAATFAPVKTVFDLLRPEHQARRGR